MMAYLLSSPMNPASADVQTVLSSGSFLHSSCRSICHSSEPQSSIICISSPRPTCSGHGCSEHNLVGLTAYAYPLTALLHRVIQKSGKWQRKLLPLKGHQQGPSTSQSGPYLINGVEKIRSTIDGYKMAFVQTLGPAGFYISQSSDLNRLLPSFYRDLPKSSRNLPKWNFSVS